MRGALNPWFVREWENSRALSRSKLSDVNSTTRKRAQYIQTIGSSTHGDETLVWIRMADSEQWIDVCVPDKVVQAYNAERVTGFTGSGQTKDLFILKTWRFVLACPPKPSTSSTSAPCEPLSRRICIRLEDFEYYGNGESTILLAKVGTTLEPFRNCDRVLQTLASVEDDPPSQEKAPVIIHEADLPQFATQAKSVAPVAGPSRNRLSFATAAPRKSDTVSAPPSRATTSGSFSSPPIAEFDWSKVVWPPCDLDYSVPSRTDSQLAVLWKSQELEKVKTRNRKGIKVDARLEQKLRDELAQLENVNRRNSNNNSSKGGEDGGNGKGKEKEKSTRTNRVQDLVNTSSTSKPRQLPTPASMAVSNTTVPSKELVNTGTRQSKERQQAGVGTAGDTETRAPPPRRLEMEGSNAKGSKKDQRETRGFEPPRLEEEEEEFDDSLFGLDEDEGADEETPQIPGPWDQTPTPGTIFDARASQLPPPPPPPQTEPLLDIESDLALLYRRSRLENAGMRGFKGVPVLHSPRRSDLLDLSDDDFDEDSVSRKKSEPERQKRGQAQRDVVEGSDDSEEEEQVAASLLSQRRTTSSPAIMRYSSAPRPRPRSPPPVRNPAPLVATKPDSISARKLLLDQTKPVSQPRISAPASTETTMKTTRTTSPTPVPARSSAKDTTIKPPSSLPPTLPPTQVSLLAPTSTATSMPLPTAAQHPNPALTPLTGSMLNAYYEGAGGGIGDSTMESISLSAQEVGFPRGGQGERVTTSTTQTRTQTQTLTQTTTTRDNSMSFVKSTGTSSPGSSNSRSGKRKSEDEGERVKKAQEVKEKNEMGQEKVRKEPGKNRIVDPAQEGERSEKRKKEAREVKDGKGDREVSTDRGHNKETRKSKEQTKEVKRSSETRSVEGASSRGSNAEKKESSNVVRQSLSAKPTNVPVPRESNRPVEVGPGHLPRKVRKEDRGGGGRATKETQVVEPKTQKRPREAAQPPHSPTSLSPEQNRHSKKPRHGSPPPVLPSARPAATKVVSVSQQHHQQSQRPEETHMAATSEDWTSLVGLFASRRKVASPQGETALEKLQRLRERTKRHLKNV